MSELIQIIGYMVVVYGVCRLWQTSDIGGKQVVGILGIAGLLLLGVLLTQQSNAIANL